MPENAFTYDQFYLIEDAWLRKYPSEAFCAARGYTCPMRMNGMATSNVNNQPDGIRITIKIHRDFSFFRLWNRVANFCSSMDVLHQIEDAQDDWIRIFIHPARF